MKYLKYLLIGLGAIFLFYIVQAVWQGFSSTANPGAMIERAQQKAAESK